MSKIFVVLNLLELLNHKIVKHPPNLLMKIYGYLNKIIKNKKLNKHISQIKSDNMV